MAANRKYKDTLFAKLFSTAERLIELYNAIAGTSYGMDTPIVLNTLVGVFFNKMKNDVSFVIDGKFVVLVEHQSTINTNMPLRFLLYIARLYEKILDMSAMYREKLLKIPTLELIVLYNGTKPFPPEQTLRLSDAFIAQGCWQTLWMSINRRWRACCTRSLTSTLQRRCGRKNRSLTDSATAATNVLLR